MEGVHDILSTMSESDPLLPQFSCSALDRVPVYAIVRETYHVVSSAIDTSLKYDQLRSPQVHSFLIKPIVHELKFRANEATLHALMANMIQFAKQSKTDITMTGVMATRSLVCEILAIKLLKEYSPDQLMDALTFDFYPLAGDDDSNSDDSRVRHGGSIFVPRWQRASTLELAVKAEAKRFLSHPVVTKVLDDIWKGNIMFQSTVQKIHRAPIEDVRQFLAYNRRGPALRYSFEAASILKLSRLRVPRYRHLLTLLSFCVMLLLYIIVLRQPRDVHVSRADVIFGVWTLAFVLDEVVGFTDVGPTLYIQSLWNIFDLFILLLLLAYTVLRVLALTSSAPQKTLATSYNVLATVAIFLFPRLFSVLDHYESFSGMVIAVRKMSIDLLIAWVVIAVLSSGFWVAFTTAFAPKDTSAGTIAYDLTKILFGFTPTVWQYWDAYSYIGRINLMFYLFITHFVIMTILIAVLSNSFAAVIENGHEEHQYLFAINTISMMKSESSGLFSYIPPLNVIEWGLRPLYYIVPLRRFLVINRTAVKITHFPILYAIYMYESLHVKLATVKLAAMSVRSSTSPGSASPRRRRRRIPKSTVSKYDVLDEVFRRPYKGSMRATSPDSQKQDIYDGDNEQNEDIDDDASSVDNPDEFLNLESHLGIHHRKASASTSQLMDVFNQQVGPRINVRNPGVRPRLFSTTSSLVQNYTRNLSISPTRSTSSVLGRGASFRQLGKRKIITSHRTRPRRRSSPPVSLTSENEEPEENSNLAQRVDNRIDEMQESMKNMQAMLEEVVSVTSHYR